MAVFIFSDCEECNFEYEGDCPEHGGLLIIEDKKVGFLGSSNRKQLL